MPKLDRNSRIQEAIVETIAEFVSRESNRTSLITVTSAAVSDSGAEATIFVTVLPEDAETVALDFLKRQRGEARAYLTQHAKIGRVPFLDFKIDAAGKMRRKIDALGVSSNQEE